jgi:hypothetical protein
MEIYIVFEVSQYDTGTEIHGAFISLASAEKKRNEIKDGLLNNNDVQIWPIQLEE